MCPPEPSCHVCRTCPGAAAWLPGPRTAAALPDFLFFFLNGLSQSSQHSARRLQARLLNRRLDLAAPSGKGSSFPFSSVPCLKLFLCPLRSSQLSSSFVRGKGQTRPLAGLKEQSRSHTLTSVVLRSRWVSRRGILRTPRCTAGGRRICDPGKHLERATDPTRHMETPNPSSKTPLGAGGLRTPRCSCRNLRFLGGSKELTWPYKAPSSSRHGARVVAGRRQSSPGLW